MLSIALLLSIENEDEIYLFGQSKNSGTNILNLEAIQTLM